MTDWYDIGNGEGDWSGALVSPHLRTILHQLCTAVNEREEISGTIWRKISGTFPQQITRSGSTATAYVANHGYKVGNSVTIQGADQSEYNGTFTITAVAAATFQFTVSGSPASPATGAITCNVPFGTYDSAAYTKFTYNNDSDLKELPTADDFIGLWLNSQVVNAKTLTSVTCGNSNVLVTHASHGLLVSNYIRVEDISETGYNGRRQVVAKSTNTFTYGVPGNPDQVTAVGKYAKELAVSSITRSGSTATATSVGHGFPNGDSVFIDGVTEPEYNGTFTIFNVTGDTFDYTVSGTPATPASGALKKCGRWIIPETVECQQDAVATATLANHRLETGWRVVIAGATQTQYNGHFQITKTGANTFTYPLPLGIPATPATGTIKVKANVNGCSVTRTGTTIGVACLEHGYEVGDVFRIQNAEQADYNNWFVITSKTAHSMSGFIATTPASPATPNTGTVLLVHKSLGALAVLMQIRRAIEKSLASTRTISGILVTFRDPLDTDVDLDLATALGRGSYGSSWVSEDRIMSLDAFMQIQEVLGQFTVYNTTIDYPADHIYEIDPDTDLTYG